MFQNLLTGLRHSGYQGYDLDEELASFQNLLTGLRHSGDLVIKLGFLSLSGFQNLLTGLRHSGLNINEWLIIIGALFQNLLTGLRHSGVLGVLKQHQIMFTGCFKTF